MGFNFLKLDQQLAEALVGLRGNRAFEIVLEKMRAHEAEESKTCLVGEGTPLHRAQGAAIALQLWQKMYADAPIVLEKFKQHSQPK